MNLDDNNSFTSLDGLEITNSNNAPVFLNILPGENIITYDSLNYGCRLALTNYRIIIINDVLKDKVLSPEIISIPLGLIYQLEQYALICLNICTKFGRKFSITFPNIELCNDFLEKIKFAKTSKPFSIEFCRTLKSQIQNHFLLNDIIDNSNQQNHEIQTIKEEFKRLNFNPHKWRISDVNKEFKICSTYPQYHIVPIGIADKVIKSMAKFRSRNRFISVSYKWLESDAVILRSGQPLTGMSAYRNQDDEDFINSINDIQKQQPFDHLSKKETYDSDSSIINDFRLKIFDARSYTSAQLNRVKGGGMEFEENYNISSIEFLSIPNMHTVRSSFESLSKAFLDSDREFFYDLVNRSNWLLLIRQLLQSASSICDVLHSKGTSVLVHCSDGWDRTSQLVSLAQIILDPFYRTIKGFKILIYREWILYGHKFNERCALWPADISREYSPIFLQWLDCVYQLLDQYPNYFHFNETFLIKLALHVYSGLFGTFNQSLSNSSNESCNIWSYLCNKKIHSFINPLYDPNSTFKMMKPQTQMFNIKLWTKLYFNALDPNHTEFQGSDKYVCEMSSEIKNIAMCNSMIIPGDEIEDYEGEEDDKSLRFILSVESDETIKNSMEISTNLFNSKVNNYFNTLFWKCISGSSEIKSVPNDSSVYFELDLDGLLRQKDYIHKFSDDNRRCRYIYKSQIAHYRKKIKILKSVKDECDTDIDQISDASHSSLSSNDEFEKIDELTRWVPDHAVSNCHNCDKPFGYIFTRKHHCRSCGNVFCDLCTQYSCPVPKERLYINVRVCSKCYEILKQSSNS